jgi:hypothetical protein
MVIIVILVIMVILVVMVIMAVMVGNVILFFITAIQGLLKLKS